VNEWNIKRPSDANEVQSRIDKAIIEISNTTFTDSKGKKHKYTKEELEADYMICDSLNNDGMHDNYYLNGKFAFLPKEKIIII
jgi:hypothetical protein